MEKWKWVEFGSTACQSSRQGVQSDHKMEEEEELEGKNKHWGFQGRAAGDGMGAARCKVRPDCDFGESMSNPQPLKPLLDHSLTPESQMPSARLLTQTWGELLEMARSGAPRQQSKGTNGRPGHELWMGL